MSLLALAGTNSATGGYEIDNSCKFEDDNDEWLYRTNATGTNTKTWTVSWWFKQTELRSVNGAATEMWQGGAYGEATRAGIFADDRIWIDIGGGDGNTGTLFRSLSTQKIRDTSAWYHIVIACDSTQSTEADRLKVWLNGVEVTAWDQKQYPTLNYESALQGTGGVQMKWGSADATYHGYSGYLAECNYVDGVTATQNDFGEFDEDTGIWKPKAYTGSYGTNGSYLDFEISSDLGANAKGNDVNFSLSNITSADQALDTPTNNFCTWNPLQTGWNTNYGTGQVIVEGATEAYASTNYAAIEGSMAVQSGKWYWESKPNRTGGIMVGVAALNGVRWAGDTAYWYLGMNAQGIGTISGNWYYNGTSTSTDASDWTNGDIVSIALDMDNYKIYMAVNGSWGGTSNPSTGTGGYDFSSASNFTSNFVVPAGRIETANSSYVIETNFGGYTTMSIASGNSDSSEYGNFEYAPPSGYYALCTKNLAEYG